MITNLKIIWNTILMAFQELRVNRMRTFLSLLGITIGIFCIIAVGASTDSLENNIRTQVNALGSDVIYIQKWSWGGGNGPYEWWKFLNRPEPTYREFQSLQSKTKAADKLAFVYTVNNQRIDYGDNYLQGITMMAVTQDFGGMQDLKIQSGRYFSPNETNGNTAVAIVGAKIWQPFFLTPEAALGKTIELQGHRLRIIGALQAYGQSMVDAFLYDEMIILPFFTSREIIDERSQGIDPMIMVKARPGVSMDELTGEVRGEMRALRRLQPRQEDNFALNQLSMITGNLEKMFSVISVSGDAIGIFALIVGVFGIANIMFVTVKERTSMIGLKKAIGAKQNIILLEFLIEAIILCIIGALIGIGLVYLLTFALTHQFHFTVYLSATNIIHGILFAVISGIVAGIIPAWFASRMDPVVAIRS
ncbi:MAG TPA: ABC transporter permease [Chitinophagaceae bacterium]|nr:ABC transporter permease [Chitinophagaceae bacterium]